MENQRTRELTALTYRFRTRRCAALVCGALLTGTLVMLMSYPNGPPEDFDFEQMRRPPLLDTAGCRIPALDPWHRSVQPLFSELPPFRCPGPPHFLRAVAGGRVALEDAVLRYYFEVAPDNVSCQFRPVLRSTIKDEDIDSRFEFGPSKPLPFDEPLSLDFLQSNCTLGNLPDQFSVFLPLTPLKTSVEKLCVQRNANIRVERPLNIIFLGLDSISRLNFVRHFPKCQRFLADRSITLEGYTKVGDNTFPNIVPLLTGHFHQYYYDATRNASMFFDDLPFSWKSFAAMGYRTLLAEDAPNMATFNYFRKGFRDVPTDYYYRPLALAIEESDIKKGPCFGSQMEMEVLYNYLKSFTDTMGEKRPYFAFLFQARLTHDVFNYAGYADEPTYQVLKYLEDTKVLNNSLLVFFSDHGIRFGEIRKTRIGQYEERMPFMHLLFPEWFLDQHRHFHRNLNINRKRLTTPFDVHATMMHLASLTAGKKFRVMDPTAEMPGVSLLNEVPPIRTCSDAGISPHWCPCQESKPVSKELPVVRQASEAVIRNLNERLKPYTRNLCSELLLNTVMDARVANGTSGEYFVILLSTLPGDGQFEATVRRDDGRCTDAARSPMLSGDTREAASGHVDIEDLDPHTLGRFLAFLYSGATGGEALGWEEASKLYYAADKYQVPSLKSECLSVLCVSVSLENVCDILALADRHHDKKLTSVARSFILKNFNKVLETVEWNRFSNTNPSLLLKTVTHVAKSNYDKINETK